MSGLRTLESAREVVDTLGGTTQVARDYGLRKPQSVWAWIGVGGNIPPKYYTSMMAELAKRGCTAPPGVWGMHGAEYPGA